MAQCTGWGAENYRCVCDTRQGCSRPSGPLTGDDADAGDANAGCPEVAATSGEQALQEGCGLTSGQNGFCEVHSGGQSVQCFELPAGGFECHCPNLSEPVLSAEQDCRTALVRSCSSDCENETGRCAFGDNDQYRCDCAVGISSAVHAPLCEDALQAWCEPSCENDRGSCYWHPDHTRLVCRCAGSAELHESTPDRSIRPDAGGPPPPPNPYNECRTQLARDCGS